jgi:hypothetical protein
MGALYQADNAAVSALRSRARMVVGDPELPDCLQKHGSTQTTARG